MAITQNDLISTISVDVADAAKSVKSLQEQFKGLDASLKDMSKTATKSADSLTDIGATATKVNQAIELAQKGIRLLIDPLRDSIKAFTDSQDVTDKFRNTLTLLGERNLDKTVTRFQDLADSIEDVTGVESEQIVKLATMGKTLGIADDQLQKLLETSVDLAAATGDDVNEAFRRLNQSMLGQTRALGPLAKLTEGFTEAQLKAGKGIDVIAERLKGFGASAATTFGGQMKLLQVNIGNIMEEIGEILVKGFRLGNTSELLSSLGAVKKAIIDIKPDLIAALQGIRDAADTLVRSISGINWADLAKSVGIVVAAFAAFKVGTGIYAAIQALGGLAGALQIIGGPGGAIVLTQLQNFFMAQSWVAGAKAIAIATGEFVLMATALIAVAGAVDIIARNFSHMQDVIKLVAYSFVNLARRFEMLLTGLAADALGAIEGLAAKLVKATGLGEGILQGIRAATQGLGNDMVKTNKEIEGLDTLVSTASEKVDFGFIGQGATFIGDLMKGAEKKAEDATKAVAGFGQDGIKSVTGAAQEASKLLEELQKKVVDLQKQRDDMGKSEGQLLQLRFEQQMAELKVLEDKLKAEGKLLGVAQEQLEAGRKAIEQIRELSIADLRKKNLDDVTKQTEEMQRTIAMNDALTLDRIDMEKKAQLDLLNEKRKVLGLDADINAEALKQLDIQQKLIEGDAAKKASTAPGRGFEGLAKSGQQMAGQISQVFTEGAAGMVAGAMTGAGAIADAVQGLIDFIPAILSKIAGVFNSLTDLPILIVKGVNNVLDSILNFIANFIPNVIKMVDGLITGLTKFLIDLPKTVANLLSTLPGMILGLLDKLPDMITTLVENLSDALPEIVVSLIEFIIKDAPRIAFALAKFIAIQLPIAIIKGLLNAMKSTAKLIIGMFTGKFPKIQMDTQQISKGLKATAEKLTGETAKMFAVVDLKDGASAISQGKQLLADIGKATKNSGMNIWKAFVQAFNDALNWFGDRGTEIWNGFILPLANWFGDRGTEIWNGFILPLANWFGDRGTEIWNGFILPLAHWFGDRGTEIWDGFIKPLAHWFGDRGTEIWDGFIKPLAHWFGDRGTEIWDGFIKPIFSWFGEAGTKIWNGFIKPVAAWFGDRGTEIWNSFKALFGGIGKFFSDAFKNADLSGLFNNIKGVFDKIIDSLKDGLTALFKGLDPSNLFDKMFNTKNAFEPKGDVETILGYNIPFLKFAKGTDTVPGRAAVPGDSSLNDRVVAMLSPGEAVIPRSQMANPLIRQLVQAILEGNLFPPGFASGGVLKKFAGGDFKGALKDVQNVSPSQLVNEAKNLGDSVSAILGKLSPDQLWGMVRDRVDDIIRNMFESNKFHGGGMVQGRYAIGGEVPMTAKVGEFVVNERGVAAAGSEFLSAINRGQSPNTGGTVINIGPFHISAMQPVDEMIKTKVIPKVKEELRRLSLDGRTVIYDKGVRTI